MEKPEIAVHDRSMPAKRGLGHQTSPSLPTSKARAVLQTSASEVNKAKRPPTADLVHGQPPLKKQATTSPVIAAHHRPPPENRARLALKAAPNATEEVEDSDDELRDYGGAHEAKRATAHLRIDSPTLIHIAFVGCTISVRAHLEGGKLEIFVLSLHLASFAYLVHHQLWRILGHLVTS